MPIYSSAQVARLKGSETVDHLGTTYLRVATSNVFGGLRGTFALDDQGQWKLLVMLISSPGVELLYPARDNGGDSKSQSF